MPGLARRHISSSQNTEVLLARTEDSAVLEVFEAGRLVIFEETCPQEVGAVTGDVQNQEKTSATFGAVGPRASPRWL